MSAQDAGFIDSLLEGGAMQPPLSLINISADMQQVVRDRADQRYLDHAHAVAVRADHTFARLMIVQWLAAIAAAVVISPRTWLGVASTSHIHVWGAIFVGGALSLPTVFLSLTQPGAPINRYVTAVAQMLTSALLIHLTGGRIETHFHVFGSLAFLSLYRDWKVLIPATAVAAIDHLVRGVFWPESVFGITAASQFRWVEHAGWVIFEDVVLIVACLQSQQEMKQMADQWAHLSVTKDLVDAEVDRQVTELARGDERIRGSELRMRKIIDTAYDAFVVVSPSREIVEWSTRAEAVFGWSRGEAVGQSISTLLGIGGLTAVLEGAQDEMTVIEQTNQKFEASARHKNGSSIPVEVSVSGLCHNGDCTFNVFIHDISQRKHMQTQLLHAQKMQGVGQLAAGIAHEINTPTQYAGDNMRFLMDSFRDIDSILAQFDDELGEDQPPSQEDWSTLHAAAKSADLPYLRGEIPAAIGQALDGIQRIAEITRAMKEFSHPGTVAKQSVDIHRTIENSITVCRNEWKHVADLKTDFDPEITALDCLPGELSQVFVNLIVNAVQAIGEQSGRPSDRKGEITVRTRRIGDAAEISVEDNGPGIPPDVLARVFEPFFTTKVVGKGTGQGLAIAHAVVVEKHQGTIRVESQVGQGTSFIITLPLRGDANVQETTHEMV
jgi:PAS domain S-box-containing protein